MLSSLRILNSKRKTIENAGPLLNEVSPLVTEDTEKAELLNAFFALVYTAKTTPWEPQTLEILRREGKGRLLFD